MSEQGLQEATYPCPACGSRLYGWTVARHPLDGAKLVLDRCESCGLGVTRAPQPPDPAFELAALERDGTALVAANRRSFQGGIGGAQWAGLEPERRRLHLNPEAARLLLAGADREVVAIRTPFCRAAYLGMVQTLINAFTLRDNFARNARSGRLRPGGARGRAAFTLDAFVTVVTALPLALVALPLELTGSLLGRGGVMRVTVGVAELPSTPQEAAESADIGPGSHDQGSR